MIARSLLFAFLLLVYMICMSLFSLCVGRFFPMKKRMRVAVTTEKVISLLLKICCSIRVTVEGKENLQALAELNATGQGALIISNHQSPWETFYLQSLFYPLKTILKKELLDIPFFGWSLRYLDPVVLDRSKKIASTTQVLEQGKQRLNNGDNLLVFPQGTRMPPGSAGRFSRSATQLAMAAHSPIIAVAHNAGEHWPAKNIWMKPGTIRLVMGELIATDDCDSKAITSQYSQWIIENMAAKP